jgi:hypothetical protein
VAELTQNASEDGVAEKATVTHWEPGARFGGSCGRRVKANDASVTVFRERRTTAPTAGRQ